MTLSLAWVRKVGTSSELVMASDSRLRFGCAWDCCPKLMQMPRSDMAMCFSGDTWYAYPLMLQISSAISHFSKSRSRAMDLHDMKGKVIEVFNHMRNQIGDLPRGQEEPETPKTFFIVGGFSWKKKRFAIWLIHFDPHRKKFTFRPTRAWGGGNRSKQLCISGDYLDDFKTRLLQKLRAAGKLEGGGFDMEPFEVLRDMLRSGLYPLIGGPPQMLKVQEHMNCTAYSIYWPDRQSGTVSLMGRPLLPYEVADAMIIDPDTLELYGRDSNVVRLVR